MWEYSNYHSNKSNTKPHDTDSIIFDKQPFSWFWFTSVRRCRIASRDCYLITISTNPASPMNIKSFISISIWRSLFISIWLIGKDPDAVKDWGQEEGGATEDRMVGRHHWFNGHEFEQILGDGEGQGSLVCCSPRGHKELTWLSS